MIIRSYYLITYSFDVTAYLCQGPYNVGESVSVAGYQSHTHGLPGGVLGVTAMVRGGTDSRIK